MWNILSGSASVVYDNHFYTIGPLTKDAQVIDFRSRFATNGLLFGEIINRLEKCDPDVPVVFDYDNRAYVDKSVIKAFFLCQSQRFKVEATLFTVYLGLFAQVPTWRHLIAFWLNNSSYPGKCIVSLSYPA